MGGDPRILGRSPVDEDLKRWAVFPKFMWTEVDWPGGADGESFFIM